MPAEQEYGYRSESALIAFTEFRSKTEFSDMAIAGDPAKSEFFSQLGHGRLWHRHCLSSTGLESKAGNEALDQVRGQSNKGLQPPPKSE
jgi:hypothetical protein